MLVKDIKIFLNEEKKKSNNIITSIPKTKISQNMMEIKSCLEQKKLLQNKKDALLKL